MPDPNQFFLSPSSEFVNLCQSQVAILTQGLGATWTIVYLTEELLTDRPQKLTPIVVYPSTDVLEKNDSYLTISPEVWQQYSTPLLLAPASETQDATEVPAIANLTKYLGQGGQVVFPLLYEDWLLGALVTGRSDREWNQRELTQLENIAHTLAIARLLDQRQTWYQQKLQEQEQIRHVESNRLDDLLHQLRNPITALRTFSKLLLKRFLPQDRNRKIAQSILRESDHLQELLQQFEEETPLTRTEMMPHPLSESHSGTGNFLLPSHNLKLEAVSLPEILAPLLTSAQALTQEKNIELTVDFPSDLPTIKGNASALREIFSNLIGNAIKYTPAGGKIKVASQQKPHWQGIAISDNGYGIPPADREHIFERHYRGVQEKSDIPGTGLGLAIAKELVTQLRGEIELISPNQTAPNSLPGTTFIVWLPT